MKLGDESKSCRESSDARWTHIFLKGGSTLKSNLGGSQLNSPNKQCMDKGQAGCFCFNSCSIRIGHRADNFVSLTKWYLSPHYEDLHLLLNRPKLPAPLTLFERS